jgi:proline-specific peptidase
MASDATKSHIFQQLFSIKILTKISYRVTRDTLNTAHSSQIIQTHAQHIQTHHHSHTPPLLSLLCVRSFLSLFVMQQFVGRAQTFLGLPIRTGWLPVRAGGDIWYGVFGNQSSTKPPLVTIHGGPGGDSSGLAMSLRALGEERQVIVYDQLGGGRSRLLANNNNKELWQIERFVNELRHVLSALAPHGAHLLGHSWGTIPLCEHLLNSSSYNNVSATFASPVLNVSAWENDAARLVQAFPEPHRTSLLQMIETRTSHDFLFKKSLHQHLTLAEEDAFHRYGASLILFYQQHVYGQEQEEHVQNGQAWKSVLYRWHGQWLDECTNEYYRKKEGLVVQSKGVSIGNSPTAGSGASFLGPAYEAMWGPNEFTQTGTLKGYDASPRLHQLVGKVPMLFTCGRDDIATPETLALLAMKANAKMTVFEKSAHAPHRTERQHYLAVLRTFFNKVENQSGESAG